MTYELSSREQECILEALKEKFYRTSDLTLLKELNVLMERFGYSVEWLKK